MDSVSFDMMRWCIDLCKFQIGTNYRVLDIGSADVNGTNKPLFDIDKWKHLCIEWSYFGIDIAEGKNVDLVVEPYNWPFIDGLFDLTISSSCLEHVEDMYAWCDEAIRVTKKDGYIIVIVPALWNQHRCPIDCWRIYPDGMRWLFIKRTNALKEMFIGHYKPEVFEYCYGVFQKL